MDYSAKLDDLQQRTAHTKAAIDARVYADELAQQGRRL